MSLRALIENNRSKIKKLQKLVEKIEILSGQYSQLSDNQLQTETDRFKTLYANGTSLDQLLPEAFAAIREADKRILGIYPYPVQLMGGIVLHQGNLAEMKTGEGKTITETMPTYLNALAGKGVHVVTVNDYLSKRDFEEMSSVFTFMGLTVGQNGNDMSIESKQRAYNCDITYSTNDALAFDYLRDNMALFKADQVQRYLNYVIVDEIDSILIDEARTPLIIAGDAKSYKTMYKQADELAKRMTKEDYEIDQETKTITLKRSGILKANNALGLKNVYGKDSYVLAHYLDMAMKANYTMDKDKDYIVKDGQVLIVDTFTGRVMEGRRFSDGLHQALEAKENLTINDANKTEATITYQNYFKLYKKLAGMTGTAATESQEFYETFGMQVVSIPTNRPNIRKDMNDELYPTEKSKFRAAVKKIEKVHASGQPILVGTASVEHSELISNLLSSKNIPHTMLNAKNNEKEAEVIAMAGQLGAVTIATNMAGRGTDIKLGPGVEQLGGLFVLGTEKHESRRIDDQLRGRAARQGNPGITVFYMSLEDELITRFGGKQAEKIKKKSISNNTEMQPIKSNRIIDRTIIEAQRRVEGNNFDQRKEILRYDDVMNEQRKDFYNERQKIIDYKGDLTSFIIGMLARTIIRVVDKFYLDFEHANYRGLVTYVRESLNLDLDPEGTLEEFKLADKRGEKIKRNLKEKIEKNKRFHRISLSRLKTFSKKELREYIFSQVKKEVNDKKSLLVDERSLNDFERIIMLRQFDYNWKSHIYEIEQLREAVTLRGYGQYNPLVEYQKMAHTLYQQMVSNIEKDVSEFFLTAEIRESVQ